MLEDSGIVRSNSHRRILTAECWPRSHSLSYACALLRSRPCAENERPKILGSGAYVCCPPFRKERARDRGETPPIPKDPSHHSPPLLLRSAGLIQRGSRGRCRSVPRSESEKGVVTWLLQIRGRCNPFWLILPPLRVAPGFACSVASLSRSPGH